MNNKSRSYEYTLPVIYTVDNGINISNVTNTPDAFSPNEDGKYDSTTISYLISRDAAVTVKIYDAADNTLVRTLKDQAQETAGTNTVIWDGKDDSGSVFTEGIYT